MWSFDFECIGAVSLYKLRIEICIEIVFNILCENNPELAGEKRRTVMRPPHNLRMDRNCNIYMTDI